jgi:large subunit ribosomal protein L9
MKVILLRDVARLGRKSEVKEVPDGHALNFLIPRKLAIIATPESMKKHTAEVRQHDSQKDQAHARFVEACQKLAVSVVTYKAEANAQGHLFKGVNAQDVSECLEREGYTIAKQFIVLTHPLKEIGLHKIPIRFDGVEGVCQLEIIKK